jgi:uncharacterized damage-inducible protein DinB
VTIDEARELFGYGSWANGLTLAAAKALTPEQLVAPVVSSFPSVLATLAHLVGVEWLWLRRWTGDDPGSMPEWVGAPDLPDLEARLAAVEVERAAFLTNADLDRMVSYHGLDGQAFSLRLGSLMRHVVNHSTYHRGQLATMLRQLGQTPPGTDFTRYLREAKGH